MKTLILFTTTLFLLIQTAGYSQSETTEAISNKQDTTLKKESATTEAATHSFDNFIGTYYLAEGEFNLEIVEEDKKMYIVSPFSKDILVPKNKTTLLEPTRGVNLELINGDNSALKFSQNGYVTTIKRVKS